MPGVKRLYGVYETWFKKNAVIGEELSKTFNYVRRYKTLDSGLGTFSLDIYADDGEGGTDWVYGESGGLLPNIRRVCTLAADLSNLQKFLKVEKGSSGQNFWTVWFSINVRFGGTALKARMTWYEGVSDSHSHPSGADIWLCLSGNPARRPCQRYTKLSLLDHVCQKMVSRSNERLPFCIILFDTIDAVT